LDSFLDENLDITYSCQTGICNTCKANIVSGSAKMIGIKNRNDLIKNEILLCCAFPTSDQIEIEI
jgi:ring-1,2-phenylacetyl-CoA epoxidase subunit PaaE